MQPSDLQCKEGEGGSYTFGTGALNGILRQDGRSGGLAPVTYCADGTKIAVGEGQFNHYRVFTYGRRYGYGARRRPSTATLHHDGSVEVHRAPTSARAFELRRTYRWVAPNILDLTITVTAVGDLAAFELFLASHDQPPFTDSRVWAQRDPRGRDAEGFVATDEEPGVWPAFPSRLRAFACASRTTDWPDQYHPRR